jgi:membrane protease YdiL (CAAX protease family)
VTLPAEPGVTPDSPAARPSPLKAIGWAALYVGGGFLLTTALFSVLVRLAGVDWQEASPEVLQLQTLAGLVAYGSLTLLVGVRLLRLTATDLRWAPLRLAAPGFALGFLLGAVPAGAAISLSLLGGASFVPDEGSWASYGAAVLRLLVLLAPAALFEEIVFRGVGQVVLARAIGPVRAVVCFASLFALAHLANPNATALGLFNIALAGVFLGIAFYAPGGIWTAWGAHLGWNTTLAALDTAVSGLALDLPRIDYIPAGPAWLTGGTFGPEGGLFATGMIALATATAWRWTRKETA